MFKIFIISIVCLTVFLGCSKYCGDGNHPRYTCTYYIILNDTSNQFTDVRFSNKSNHSIYPKKISFEVDGFETNAAIMIQHKNGMDTIVFNTIKSDLKYTSIGNCEYVYFDVLGINIVSSSFDSAYFQSPNILVK